MPLPLPSSRMAFNNVGDPANELSEGWMTVILGAVLSTIILIEVVPVFPAASVAVMVIAALPSGNVGNDICHEFWLTVAGAPFTLTLTAVASVIVPWTAS